MSQALVPTGRGRDKTATTQSEFVTVYIDGQLFGFPVLQVQDVLAPQRITPVPLAPPEVAGSLNLRGRIVTAIDIRKRLGMAAVEGKKPRMSVVVEFGGELYSLLVDSVGEVLSVDSATFECNPATLDSRWRDVSTGIHRLKDTLLIILDVSRLLNLLPRGEAA